MWVSFLGGAALASLLLLTSCVGPPPRAEQPKPDPTKEAAYADAVATREGRAQRRVRVRSQRLSR